MLCVHPPRTKYGERTDRRGVRAGARETPLEGDRAAEQPPAKREAMAQKRANNFRQISHDIHSRSKRTLENSSARVAWERAATEAAADNGVQNISAHRRSAPANAPCFRNASERDALRRPSRNRRSLPRRLAALRPASRLQEPMQRPVNDLGSRRRMRRTRSWREHASSDLPSSSGRNCPQTPMIVNHFQLASRKKFLLNEKICWRRRLQQARETFGSCRSIYNLMGRGN